jgi:phosphatidylserine/phosphatidylglycerophosphate/cardiolipin synthase-like enzyme
MLFFMLLPILMSSHAESQEISPTFPLIVELYYDAHSRVADEFVTIANPSQTSIDLSGWYVTTKPQQGSTSQPKIVFPPGTMLRPQTRITLTQNASAFQRETATLPDFEYDADSRSDIPQLATYKSVHFNNAGGTVALKNTMNQTIDMIVFGNTLWTMNGWAGLPIPDAGSGAILKRNTQNGIPVDTNSSQDWQHVRRYGIGQSNLPSQNITFQGEITLFISPDCSYNTIVGALRNATSSIYVNMYEFTDPSLYHELLGALNRHISLSLFMEGAPVGGLDDREKYILTDLASHGAHVRLIVSNSDQEIYARYQFDHAKYMVIDNSSVIVESCNWAKTGVPQNPTYGNREWGVLIRNPEVAAYFLSVFQADWDPQHVDSVDLAVMNFSVPGHLYLNESIPTGRYTPQFTATTIQGSFQVTPVFSPDTSEHSIVDALSSAQHSILVEQLTLAKDWGSTLSPFVEQLTNKAEQGIDVKVILNSNPEYASDTTDLQTTKTYLESHHVQVKLLYTNWSVFENVHNKGMIVDNNTVLVSSINWNQNSVQRNREAAVLIHDGRVASYYTSVFYADWNLKPTSHSSQKPLGIDYKSFIVIGVVILIVGILIARDWRRRKWT